jgi:predicted nucleic acid-binding protein
LNAVLIDTSVIVALLDRSEQRHAECVQLCRQLECALITCEAAVAEACYLLRNLGNASKTVLENVDAGIFQVPYRLTGRSRAVIDLMRKYANIPMDFADACLVDMATEYRLSRILTLDNDFALYRWGRNRPFELMPGT